MSHQQLSATWVPPLQLIAASQQMAKDCISTLQSHVSSIKWEPRLHSMFTSLLLQTRSVFPKATWSLRLQDICSVSAYTISSWQSVPIQQYTDNQLRVPMRSELRIWTLMMIISGGIKEFNSILTKIKIQTRLSSSYLRRLLVQSWELATKWKSKAFQNPS